MKGIALWILLCVALIPSTGYAWTLTTQEAVQPFDELEYSKHTIAAGDSVTITFSESLNGLTFATTEACSLRLWGNENTTTSYMHFEAGESFEFPDLDIDSLKVKAEATATTVRVWGWRR